MLAIGNYIQGAIEQYRRALALKLTWRLRTLGLATALAQRGWEAEAAQHLQAAAASADSSVSRQARDLLRQLGSLRR
jgi:hypothetical protein